MKIELEFEVEDLIGARLLIEKPDGRLCEDEIQKVKGNLVCLTGAEWIREEDLKVETILFRG